MSDWYGFSDYDPLGDYAAPAPAHWWDKLTDPNFWHRVGNETWFGRLAIAPFAPGDALAGKYSTPMPQSGTWSDEDEARAQLNQQALEGKAGDLANLAVGGTLPAVAARGVEGLAGEMAREPVFGSMAGAGRVAKMGDNGGPAMPLPGTNPGGFYSAAGRAAQNAPFKTPQTMEQWAAWLRNQPGVKPEELQSLGIHPDSLNPNLAGVKLDKTQMAEGFIQPNTPTFQQHVLGQPKDIDEAALEAKHPNAFYTLREAGFEPTIMPMAEDGSHGPMLGLIDNRAHADGEIVSPLDLQSSRGLPEGEHDEYTVPDHVARAAQSLHDVFEHATAPQPTKYDAYSGIRGQNRARGDGVMPDEAYRERLYQLDRPRRDEITPDGIATDKYGKSWDALVQQHRAALQEMEKTNAAYQNAAPGSPEKVALDAQRRALSNRAESIYGMMDQLHDRMIDDTLARKPYWVSRGMTANSDDIAERAQQLMESEASYGRQPDPEDVYYRNARREMTPHPEASNFHYSGGHWNPKDVLYHLRTTEGTMLGDGEQFGVRNTVSGNKGPAFDLRQNAEAYISNLPENLRGQVEIYPTGREPVIGASHHLDEVQSDWLQQMRDRGYQIPPQPEPSIQEALDAMGYKIDEVPAVNMTPQRKAEIDAEIARRYVGPRADPTHVDGAFKDSIAEPAVRDGIMTPEEATQWVAARNNPTPFKLTFKDGSANFYKTRADAEQSVMDEYKGDKNGIYRLPQGAQRFAPGDKLPDGSVAQTHAVKIPQPLRGKSMFYGATPEEAEGNALSHMRGSYNAHIPDAPFKGNWHELAMKQAVLDAVKQGKDAVTWWPGQVHADRYGFEQFVNEMRYDPATQVLSMQARVGPRAGSWSRHQIPPEQLADHVGPEIAEKLTQPINNANEGIEKVARDYQDWVHRTGLPEIGIDAQVRQLEQETASRPNDRQTAQLLRDAYLLQRRSETAFQNPRPSYNSVSGEGLKFSDKRAQGMRGFYDTMLPRTANSLFKKYGVKVEPGKVSTDRGSGDAWVMKITPKLREAVQREGLPLFQAGAPLGALLNRGRDDQGDQK